MSSDSTKDQEHEDPFIGQTIVDLRPITEAEMIDEGWDSWNNGWMCSVLELGNGTKIYPSRDSEGNGPGCLYGITPEGERTYVIADSESG